MNPKKMTRRDFIKTTGMVTAGAVLQLVGRAQILHVRLEHARLRPERRHRRYWSLRVRAIRRLNGSRRCDEGKQSCERAERT